MKRFSSEFLAVVGLIGNGQFLPLSQKVDDLKTELKRRDAENVVLKKELDELTDRVSRLASRNGGPR